MFDVGQRVTVIGDKGIAYDGFILARATGDDGPGAYKVALEGAGPGQLGQWHKASNVFVREKGDEDATIPWDGLKEL